MRWDEVNCVALLVLVFAVSIPWRVLRRDRWHPDRYRGKRPPRELCPVCAKGLPVDSAGAIPEHTFWWAWCPGSHQPPAAIKETDNG